MPKVATTVYTRIDKKRTVTLRDSTVKQVIAYIKANPGLTVDAIAIATDVPSYKINATLECVKGGIALVQAYAVIPPARGFDPAWVAHAADPKLFAAAPTSKALVPAADAPAQITAAFILEDRSDLDDMVRKLVAKSGRSPKSQKRLYQKAMETVDHQALREQDAHNRLTVVSETLADTQAQLQQEIRDNKNERKEFLSALGKKPSVLALPQAVSEAEPA